MEKIIELILVMAITIPNGVTLISIGLNSNQANGINWEKIAVFTVISIGGIIVAGLLKAIDNTIKAKHRS